MTQPLPASAIGRLIFSVRDQRVILDADLAVIYGVQPKTLNRAVKRNARRFPEEFAFKLTPEKRGALRRQIGTLNTGRGKHRKCLPLALTEHGALMASTVLNSPRAASMSLHIMRAFVKMREDQAANAAILKRLAGIDKTLLLHDAALREIFGKLRPLPAQPPTPPKPEIGFHVREDAAPYRVRRRSPRRPRLSAKI